MKQSFKLTILLLLCVIFWGIACSQKPDKIKIGYQRTEIYQHLFTAIEKGFFTDEGVEVEPVEFASANLMAEALISGRIDGTGTSAFPVIFSVEQNHPGQFKIYIVNVITRKAFPDYILVKKDSEINSLSDLKGKKIGTYPGSTILTYTKIILKNFLDTDKDITIIQLKPALQLQALETRQVDAVFVLEPIASLGVIRGIARVLQEAPLANYVMEPLPGSGSTFSPKFLKKQPKTAEKIKKAMYRALDFIRNPQNSKELKKILTKWTKMEPEVIERLRPLKYWKMEEIDRKSIQELSDLLYKNGVLEKNIETAELYYSE
jgi:NitT/TauT family transport system substrate-binding protein